MHVQLTDVHLEIDDFLIVAAASLRAETGEMVGIIGPNGSGKSTLLRSIYRTLQPVSGLVSVGDDDVWSLSSRQSAQRTAVVAQESTADFDFSVTEVVTMGRSPHLGLLQRESDTDHDIVNEAMARVGIADKANRVFATLSGGEKQRVLVARALAQRSRVLILDEPTNHLDIRAQLELLELVRDLGITTIAALHELNLAAHYCDRLTVLNRGRVVAAGSVDEVLTPALLADVFGVACHCGIHPVTGRFHLAYAPLQDQLLGEI